LSLRGFTRRPSFGCLRDIPYDRYLLLSGLRIQASSFIFEKPLAIVLILRQIVLKNIPQSFWAWSLSKAKSQNDEGEEIFVAGTKIFWF